MTTKKARIKHADTFKAEVLKLAEKVTARQLSLYESQIYGWRKAIKKMRKSTIEKGNLLLKMPNSNDYWQSKQKS